MPIPVSNQYFRSYDARYAGQTNRKSNLGVSFAHSDASFRPASANFAFHAPRFLFLRTSPKQFSFR